MSSPRLFAVSIAALALLSGCGSGLAGIVSAGGSSSSSSNEAPALLELSLLGAQNPPATIRVRVRDAEGDPVVAQFFLEEIGTGVRAALVGLEGVASQPDFSDLRATGNPVSLSSTADGRASYLRWLFTDETELPSDGSFNEDYRLVAEIAGGIQLEGTAARVGNDAPVLAVANAPGVDDELGSFVPVQLRLSDSSGDEVSLRAEYDLLDDVPDAGWQCATSAFSVDLPDCAFDLVTATSSAPTDVVYAWDTLADLGTNEGDVALRFSAVDSGGSRVELTPIVFRVDNNETPEVVLNEGQLLLSTDSERGIPVSYVVSDTEGDDVRTVFQWRRPNESFPELPQRRSELETILADPGLRLEHRICTAYPRSFEGDLVPVSPTIVRLPELSKTASVLRTRGLAGRELDVLRPARVQAEPWALNTLVQPVATLPAGDGLSALVLDRSAPGSWRLVEVDLQDGQVLCTLIDSAAGEPTALALERGSPSSARARDAALVATHVDGTWRVDRVVLGMCPDPAARRTVAVADGTTDLGPIRGIASLGWNAAVLTVGSSLVKIDYANEQDPRQFPLLTDLATPYGVVLDPTDPSRVYVAEQTARTADEPGRIVRIDLDRATRLPLRTQAAFTETNPTPRPGPLAMEEHGRLLVGCSPQPPFLNALCTVRLGTAGDNVEQLLGPVSSAFTSVAGGPDLLRLGTRAGQAQPTILGGIERRLLIAGPAPERGPDAVSIAQPATIPFGRRWRVVDSQETNAAARSGTSSVFAWDSRDAWQGRFLLRATVYDEERGESDETTAFKELVAVRDPVRLNITPEIDRPYWLAIGDLDGDSDNDIVASSTGTGLVTVFCQDAPGLFVDPPLTLGGPEITGSYVPSVAVADLDRDGDNDIVSANRDLDSLAVFLQLAPGEFDRSPVYIRNEALMRPTSVAIADINQDGALDLVSVGATPKDNVTVFFQEDGRFAGDPLVLTSKSVVGGINTVTTGDLNQDGRLDLLVSDITTETQTIFFQEPGGTFTSLTSGGPPEVADNFEVQLVDLEGDGDADIVTPNGLADTVVGYTQESPGLFGPAQILGGGLSTDAPISVSAADVDGDDDLDLIVGSAFSKAVAVLLQETPGSFDPEPKTVFDFGPFQALFFFRVRTADFDADGRVDIAAINGQDDDVAVFLQKRQASFDQAPSRIVDTVSASIPTGLGIGDMDQDGDLDLVVSTRSGSFENGNGIKIYAQDGQGSFSGLPRVVSGGETAVAPEVFTVADFDGDADQDIVAVYRDEPTLRLYRQTAPGEFDTDPLPLRGLSGFEGTISVADIDGDGRADVVAEDPLVVLFQEEDGTLAPPLEFATGLVRSFEIVDLDSDGDLDLVSAQFPGLVVHLQTSPRVFEAAPTIETTNPTFVVAGDLDADGDSDLVWSGLSTIRVSYQRAPGIFDTQSSFIGEFSNPSVIRVVDVDDDETLDVVVGGVISGGVSRTAIFRQVARDTFLETSIVDEATGVLTVITEDFDQDGDLDVATANGDLGQNSGDIRIYFGGR